LSAAEGIEVIGRAFDWSEGVERARAAEADVVVVDMTHCPECGPTTPQSAISALEGCNVVILSSPNAGPSIVDALEAGALGYLTLGDAETAQVRSTIEHAAAGRAALDAKLSTAVLTRLRTRSREAASSMSRDMPPTERESAVLQLLVRGLSNRQIAQELSVSESTVKNHLHSLYSKLGTESRSQAVGEAIRRGLAEP
jgi:DNA-binding NarL/FixJ family response regulator